MVRLQDKKGWTYPLTGTGVVLVPPGSVSVEVDGYVREGRNGTDVSSGVSTTVVIGCNLYSSHPDDSPDPESRVVPVRGRGQAGWVWKGPERLARGPESPRVGEEVPETAFLPEETPGWRRGPVGMNPTRVLPALPHSHTKTGGPNP